MVKAQKWILSRAIVGMPKEENFALVEEELPDLKDGEICCETLYASVDPYLRGLADGLKPGDTMAGTQIAKVISSKNKDYQIGDLLVENYGWKSHAVVKPGGTAGLQRRLTPDLAKGDLSPSLGLGIVGMPGATAYFGLLKICEAKAGEVVYVNAAAGAVGSVVGQIAKIKGCKVIGCAGTEEKCCWLKELGFDHAFNYKTCDVIEELKKAAPEGIDCFFDNVGGETTMQIVMQCMKNFGRVAICGAISMYHDETLSYPAKAIIYKQIKLHGFLVSTFKSELDKATTDLAQWIREGKLKYKEHVVEGFKNIPNTFIGLFTGDNTGKAVIKI